MTIRCLHMRVPKSVHHLTGIEHDFESRVASLKLARRRYSATVNANQPKKRSKWGQKNLKTIKKLWPILAILVTKFVSIRIRINSKSINQIQNRIRPPNPHQQDVPTHCTHTSNRYPLTPIDRTCTHNRTYAPYPRTAPSTAQPYPRTAPAPHNRTHVPHPHPHNRTHVPHPHRTTVPTYRTRTRTPTNRYPYLPLWAQ